MLFPFLKIISTRFGNNRTYLNINGENFLVGGTKERLLYNVKDLLVAVGGFLGLFIGLSLNDVVDDLIDVGDKIIKEINIV